MFEAQNPALMWIRRVVQYTPTGKICVALYLGHEQLEPLLKIVLVLYTATLEVGVDHSKTGLVDHSTYTIEFTNTIQNYISHAQVVNICTGQD